MIKRDAKLRSNTVACVSPKSSMNKKVRLDAFSPAVLFATQWYFPLSSFFTSSITSWLWIRSSSRVFSMTFVLGLDCKASVPLFFLHVMNGIGWPLAVQFKVTSIPATTVWFFGLSTVSSTRKAETDNPRWQRKMCWEKKQNLRTRKNVLENLVAGRETVIIWNIWPHTSSPLEIHFTHPSSFLVIWVTLSLLRRVILTRGRFSLATKLESWEIELGSGW